MYLTTAVLAEQCMDKHFKMFTYLPGCWFIAYIKQRFLMEEFMQYSSSHEFNGHNTFS